MGDLEAAGEAAGPLACNLDRARALVDPKVVAAQLARDEASRPRDAAAQVEHRGAGCDAGPLRERSNLARAHEALLLHVLTRRVGRHPGPLQRHDERHAVILLHGVITNRFTASTVVPLRC